MNDVIHSQLTGLMGKGHNYNIIMPFPHHYWDWSRFHVQYGFCRLKQFTHIHNVLLYNI